MFRHARTNSWYWRRPSSLESISTQANDKLPNFFSRAFLKPLASDGGPAAASDRWRCCCTSPRVEAELRRPRSKSGPWLSEGAPFPDTVDLLGLFSNSALFSGLQVGSNCSGRKASSPFVSSFQICFKLPANCMFRHARTNSWYWRRPSSLESISTQANDKLPNFFSRAFLKPLASDGGPAAASGFWRRSRISPSVRSFMSLRRGSVDPLSRHVPAVLLARFMPPDSVFPGSTAAVFSDPSVIVLKLGSVLLHRS